MFSRTSIYLAAAGLLLLSSGAKAVTFMFAYDPSDILVNNASAVFTGSATAPTLIVSGGSTITIGVDVTVTNNPNSSIAYHGVYDSANQFLEPQDLGVLAYGFGFTSSNYAAMNFDIHNVALNSNFGLLSSKGYINSDGSIASASISGASGFSNQTRQQLGAPLLSYGADPGSAELFSGLGIDIGKYMSGQLTINPDNPLGANAYWSYSTGGNTTTSAPVYRSTTMGVTDTDILPPPLTIIFTAVPEPSCSLALVIAGGGLLRRRRAGT